MKAIRVEKQGGPEVLKLLDVAPLEAPGPGQAVVRVVAAGVNFVDVGQRRGTYPRQVPFTLGFEGAGVVESVGEGVRNVKPSDRVAFTGSLYRANLHSRKARRSRCRAWRHTI